MFCVFMEFKELLYFLFEGQIMLHLFLLFLLIWLHYFDYNRLYFFYFSECKEWEMFKKATFKAD